jgi:hypothetical protein
MNLAYVGGIERGRRNLILLVIARPADALSVSPAMRSHPLAPISLIRIP